MQKIAEDISKEGFIPFYINLRGYTVAKYDEFLRIFFETYKSERELKRRVREILESLEGVHSAIPVAKAVFLSFFEKHETADAFKYVENFLKEVRRRGRTPVIIFDELQVIKDVKIDDFLIYKLFNFFVHLTKELHLAHVFAVTSDSLFIENLQLSYASRKGKTFAC